MGPLRSQRQTNASYLAAISCRKGRKIASAPTPIVPATGTEQGAIVVTGIDAGKFAPIVEALVPLRPASDRAGGNWTSFRPASSVVVVFILQLIESGRVVA